MPTIPAPRRRLSHADRGAARRPTGEGPDRRGRPRGARRLVRSACQVLSWPAVAVFVWLMLPTQYGGRARGPLLRRVTVSTTATGWGAGGPPSAAPRWTWTVRGDTTQPVVKAGSPVVWTYCT